MNDPDGKSANGAEAPDVERARINSETSKIAWQELQRFFAQGIAVAVAPQLDLVEVAPKERPPVCRIMDYGKFKYEQTKKRI